jgi:flagellar biosynthesis GTPase FlhF
MSDNTSRLIEVEVTSDEADKSIEESDDIVTNEEERHTWIWSEQIRLVELVELHTKNWANILTILHSEHLCTKIFNAKKLQAKFTSINAPASAFRTAFKKTKFSAPSIHPETGNKLSKKEVKTLEKDLDTAEEQRRKDHAATQARLDKIQQDEIKASKGHGKKQTIEEVQNTITAEELKRKNKTKAQIESARKEAMAYREWQTLMIALLKELVLAMKQTNTLMARLQNDIYPTQLWCDSVSKLVKFIPYLFCDIFTFGAKIISASA